MSRAAVRLRGLCTGLLLCVAVIGAGGTPASAATPDIAFTASLNGRDVSSLTSDKPLDLATNAPLEVTLQVTNNTGQAITVVGTRLHGEVMGLSLFSYDTQIGLNITAGSTQRTQFQIGPANLSGQAVGLLPTTLELIGTDARVISRRSITVDVDGDLTSTYGVLGIAVAALSLLWLVSLVFLLVRRSLPSRRSMRAVEFAVAGVGVGLSLTFVLSAASLMTPVAALWLPLVLGGAAIGLVAGWFTPGKQPVHIESERAIVAALTETFILSGPRPALSPARLQVRPSPRGHSPAVLPPGGPVGASVTRRPPENG